MSFARYYVKTKDKPSWCRIGWHRWRFKGEQGFSDRRCRCERCGDWRIVKATRKPDPSPRVDPLPGDPDEAY